MARELQGTKGNFLVNGNENMEVLCSCQVALLLHILGWRALLASYKNASTEHSRLRRWLVNGSLACMMSLNLPDNHTFWI